MHYHQPPAGGRLRPPPPPPQWTTHPAAVIQGTRPWPPMPPQAMDGPPRFVPRPMLMPAHQHYASGPVFRRPPPPLPVDPDALWLQSFERQHLQSSNAPLVESRRREPPLRQLRVRLARMQSLLEQLQTVAAQVVELDTRLSVESDAQELELTRVRVQRDRKRGICIGLKSELEQLASHSVHLPPDRLAEIKRFAQRVQLKKKARRDAKTQRQAESAIHRAMAASSTKLDESAHKQEPQQQQAELEALEQATKLSALGHEKRVLEEREKARKVLLLLDLKEQRRQNQRAPLDDEERVLLEQTRDMAMKCLGKRSNRPRASISTPPESASQSQTPVQLEGPIPRTESCDALTDPETIDMETLICRRSQWDRFLVSASNVPGASSIPPHFVPPPRTPSASWAIYLHTQTM